MSESQDITKWRVLVVDDEPDCLELIGDVLEAKGAIVARAESGQRALEIIESFDATVIMLDLAMPELSGYEVHQELRAMPRFDSVPIIALTAHAMAHDARKVMEAGFDDHITKPFRVNKLLGQIEECVEQFAQQRARS